MDGRQGGRCVRKNGTMVATRRPLQSTEKPAEADDKVEQLLDRAALLCQVWTRVRQAYSPLTHFQLPELCLSRLACRSPFAGKADVVHQN